MKPFGAFYTRLTRHEVNHPTAEQLAELRHICETAFGVAHDAPYAEELFSRACELLGTDGSIGGVGYVYRCYEDLAELVKRVLASAEGAER